MKVMWVLVCLAVVIGLLMGAFGCATTTPTPTSKPTPTSTPTSTPTPTQTTTTPAAKPIIWKWQLATPPTNPLDYGSAKLIADEVKTKSGGRFTIELYPSSGLGIKLENMPIAVQDGTVEVSIIYGSSVTGSYPILDIANLCGVLPFEQQIYKKVYAAMWPYWKQPLEAKGMMAFGAGHLDAFLLFTKKTMSVPVIKLDELLGQKIRVSGTSKAAALSSLGANPIYMDYAEVYTALQRGTVEGVVTSGGGVLSDRFYEATKYIVNVPMPNSTYVFVCNKKAFDSLTPDLQKIFKDAMELYAGNMSDRAFNENKNSVQQLVQKGMTLTDVPPEAITALRGPVAQKSWTDYLGRLDATGLEAWEKLRAIVGLQWEYKK